MIFHEILFCPCQTVNKLTVCIKNEENEQWVVKLLPILFNTKQLCSLNILCSNHNCHCFSELDLIPAFATFLSCLFIRLELGIVIGIGINVLFLLYASARPSVRVEKAVVSTL